MLWGTGIALSKTLIIIIIIIIINDVLKLWSSSCCCTKVLGKYLLQNTCSDSCWYMIKSEVFVSEKCVVHSTNRIYILISGFRSEVGENWVLLRYYCAPSRGNSLPTFRENLSVLSSRVKNLSVPKCRQRITTTCCAVTYKSAVHDLRRALEEYFRSLVSRLRALNTCRIILLGIKTVKLFIS